MKLIYRYLLFMLSVVLVGTAVLPHPAQAQSPASKKKHILIIAETKGFEHDSIPDAAGTIWKMGKETGLWDAYIRTDCELITKKSLKMNAKNLGYFDAIVFASTTGELNMTEDQKADMMSFIKEDGKGFVGVHAALDTFYKWPEYGEMIGGWFDQHPWNTFDAPILLEAPDFPATKHFKKSSVKKDEIYQAKEWSRDKVNVLLRLDENKLNYDNPRIHRKDHDFAVAWSKTYGKGRVFYSTLGHTNEAWTDPDIQKMYLEAVKWVLGMTEGSTQSHARTPNPAGSSR